MYMEVNYKHVPVLNLGSTQAVAKHVKMTLDWGKVLPLHLCLPNNLKTQFIDIYSDVFDLV